MTEIKKLEITNILNTDTINFTECPRCGALPGDDCAGWSHYSPHVQRIADFIKSPDYNEANYRRRSLLGTELNGILGKVTIEKY